MTTALLIAVPLLWPVAVRAQWKTRWEYEGAKGPAYWGDLDPDYVACKTGREQSPIDIRNAEKADLPALRFEYKSSPLKYLINNGHTIRVNYHDAPGTGNFLVVADKRYQLTQFHFHRPSEEYIRGEPYEMEVHFMHADSAGHVAGVTVFLKTGSANETFQRLWEHVPTAESEEKEIAGTAINPAGLLPSDVRGYYMYRGSQTAPPCSEKVTWIVLKTPVEISAEQINQFAKLYPHDVRPIQPLNGRIVKESR
jgi:carbonic anhydrase